MPSRIFASDLLDGQVVLVTGGGSGLGRATAVELCACGAGVVICGREPRALAETTEQCEGGRCEAIECDIRDADQVSQLVDEIVARHGRIDTLVNNAGGQFMAPAEEVTPKGFHAVVRLNLEGTWLVTSAVARKAMIPAGGGKVVSVTLSPHNGLPGMAHSSAARAAVENMTRALSIEWARFNIRLNAVAAGHIATDALRKYPPQVTEQLAATVPLGRLGRPQEHAWLICYLASPAADYFSGTVLTLDGGRDNWLGPWPPPGLTDEQGSPLRETRPQA